MAGAFSMPILSVLDDPMPLEITGGLLPGRCEAARSFKAAAEAAVAAQQRRGSHRAAQAHRPRVSRGSGDAARLACSAGCRLLCICEKSGDVSLRVFLALLPDVCVRVLYLTLPTLF